MSSFSVGDGLWGDWQWEDPEADEPECNPLEDWGYQPSHQSKPVSKTNGWSGWWIVAGVVLFAATIISLNVYFGITQRNPDQTVVLHQGDSEYKQYKSIAELCKDSWWSQSHCIRLVQLANPGLRDDLVGAKKIFIPGDTKAKVLEAQAARDALRCHPRVLDSTGNQVPRCY